MHPGYHIYKDRAGEYRWNFIATNGRKIADSGEGYRSKQHAVDGVNIMMATTTATPFYDDTGES